MWMTSRVGGRSRNGLLLPSSHHKHPGVCYRAPQEFCLLYGAFDIEGTFLLHCRVHDEAERSSVAFSILFRVFDPGHRPGDHLKYRFPLEKYQVVCSLVNLYASVFSPGSQLRPYLEVFPPPPDPKVKTRFDIIDS